MSEPAGKSCSKTTTGRLHWSDTSLHLLSVGNSDLMLEVWLNIDATHFVIRYDIDHVSMFDETVCLSCFN